VLALREQKKLLQQVMKQLAGVGKGSGGGSGECNAPHKKVPQQCITQIIQVVDRVYTGFATCGKFQHTCNMDRVNAKNHMARDTYNKKHTCYIAALQREEKFEYEFKNGDWRQITNSTCIAQLTKLIKEPPSATSVTYTIGVHQYNATVSQSPSGPAGTGSGEVRIVQKNMSHVAHTTRSIRWVRLPKPVLPEKPVLEPPPPCMWPIQLLFRETPLRFFNTATLVTYLKEHDFNSPASVVCPSPAIASLATLFSSFTSKYTYDQTLCELWVKPEALQTFLLNAKLRKYTRGRLVMHGSSNYADLRNDPYGYDMSHSKQRNRYGPGLYLGLSDTVPTNYNRSSGFPDGTGILGIAMFPDGPPSEGHSIQYTIPRFSGKDPLGHSVKDCCFIRRPEATFLALGFAVAQR